MRRLLLAGALAALVLLALPACTRSDAGSGSGSRESTVSDAPVDSTTDVGAIRGKANRAAVAADLRAAMTSAEAAAVDGTPSDPQAVYRRSVEQVAKKYGITASEVEDVARQYGIGP